MYLIKLHLQENKVVIISRCLLLGDGIGYFLSLSKLVITSVVIRRKSQLMSGLYVIETFRSKYDHDMSLYIICKPSVNVQGHESCHSGQSPSQEIWCYCNRAEGRWGQSDKPLLSFFLTLPYDNLTMQKIMHDCGFGIQWTLSKTDTVRTDSNCPS